MLYSIVQIRCQSVDFTGVYKDFFIKKMENARLELATVGVDSTVLPHSTNSPIGANVDKPAMHVKHLSSVCFEKFHTTVEFSFFHSSVRQGSICSSVKIA